MADPTLGARIRAAREGERLTQAELGLKLGVSRETISNWETGETSPRSRLGEIMKLLKIDAETVVPPPEGGVLLDLPEETLNGLSAAERDEVVTAARLRALEKAREIRGSQ